MAQLRALRMALPGGASISVVTERVAPHGPSHVTFTDQRGVLCTGMQTDYPTPSANEGKAAIAELLKDWHLATRRHLATLSGLSEPRVAVILEALRKEKKAMEVGRIAPSEHLRGNWWGWAQSLRRSAQAKGETPTSSGALVSRHKAWVAQVGGWIGSWLHEDWDILPERVLRAKVGWFYAHAEGNGPKTWISYVPDILLVNQRLAKAVRVEVQLSRVTQQWLDAMIAGANDQHPIWVFADFQRRGPMPDRVLWLPMGMVATPAMEPPAECRRHLI